MKTYVAAGGVKVFKSPERPKLLDGLEDWLRGDCKAFEAAITTDYNVQSGVELELKRLPSRDITVGLAFAGKGDRKLLKRPSVSKQPN